MPIFYHQAMECNRTARYEHSYRPYRNEVLNAIPLKRMPDIDECVQPVLFLASDAASYMTGTILDVNGGRLMPSS